MWQTAEMFSRFFFTQAKERGENLLCHKNPNFKTQAKATKQPNVSPIGSYIIYYYSFTFYLFLTIAYTEGATLINPTILLDKSVYSSIVLAYLCRKYTGSINSVQWNRTFIKMSKYGLQATINRALKLQGPALKCCALHR